MKVQVKNRNLLFIALFAITATFLLGGYVSRKKAEKVLEATKTTLNGEIYKHQYTQTELSLYIKSLESLVRDQTLLISKGEEVRKELRSENIKQKERIKELEGKLDSIPLLPSSTTH